MKIKLPVLLLLFFVFGYLSAQEVIFEGNTELNTSYADTINHIFEHLDKTKIPHGLLLDQAIEFTHISAYHGAINDTNQVYIGNYKAIYNTLLMSRTQQEGMGFISLDSLQHQWLNLRKERNPKGAAQPHIVLGGLYFSYARFAENALDEGKLLIENNQVFDVYDSQGTWEDPYEVKEVLAITPPISHLKSLSLRVSLPQSLWLTNQAEVVDHIEMDFGDGNGFKRLPKK